jgi:hypothetical protein
MYVLLRMAIAHVLLTSLLLPSERFWWFSLLSFPLTHWKQVRSEWE